MKNFRYQVLLWLAAAALVQTASAQPTDEYSRGFGVSPPKVTVSVTPGGRTIAEFTMWNSNEAAAELYSIEIADLEQSPTGAVSAVPIGQGTRSCAEWLTLPEKIEIPGGAAQTVRVEVRCPPSATGAYYAILKVATGEPEKQGEGMAISVRPTLGVTLEVVIPRPAATHLEMEELTYVPGGPLKAAFLQATVHNTGVWKKPIEGDILINDGVSLFPLRISLPNQSNGTPYDVYPQSTLQLQCELPRALEAGTYEVSARLKLTASAKAHKEFQLKVPAGANSGLAVAAIGGAKLELDANLKVEPDLVELTLPPGGTRTIPVKVRNDDDRLASIHARVTQVRMEPNGMLTYVERASETPEWLTVSPEAVELEPKRMTTLRALATIPKGDSTVLPLMAVVQLKVDMATNEFSGDWSSGGDFAVLVMAMAPRAKPATLTLDKLEVVRSNPNQNPSAVVLKVTNSGEQIARVFGDIIVTGEGYGQIAKQEVGKVQSEMIFPGVQREFRMPIPPLDRGDYKVSVSLSTGKGGGMITKDIDFKAHIGLPKGLKR